MGDFERVAKIQYEKEYKKLDEQEQWAFENWLAGYTSNEMYVVAWRIIDYDFQRLEEKRTNASNRMNRGVVA